MSASQAYHAWVNAGRPWRLAGVISRISELAKAHNIAVLGTIGNEAHLQSNPPEDHTPFSATAWPVKLPGYIVTAIDLAGAQYGPKILADAKAGRAPWVKYLNYSGKHYDINAGWVPTPSSDQHLHISIRTDYIDASIGSWDPFLANQEQPSPGGGTIPVTAASEVWTADIIPAPDLYATKENPNWMAMSFLREIANRCIHTDNIISGLQADVAALRSEVAALKLGGGDPAAFAAAVAADLARRLAS